MLDLVYFWTTSTTSYIHLLKESKNWFTEKQFKNLQVIFEVGKKINQVGLIAKFPVE